jgi:hypothetical protein
MALTVFTLEERPELRAQISPIHTQVWPRFMSESPIADRAWDLLFTAFAPFQVALCDEEGAVVAAGHTVPLVWDGRLDTLPEGWDTATLQGIEDHEAGRMPSALNAYAIVVDPTHQGAGHSSTILAGLRAAATRHGLHSLIACVRPTFKARYPLTPIERYAQWRRADGAPFDPWMRVHVRAGAQQLQPSPRSMVITGTVTEWEDWTGLVFPDSGPYVIEGALQPVLIDREADLGRYEDPNIWMWHKIRAAEG